MPGLHATRYLIVKLVKFVMMNAKIAGSRKLACQKAKLMNKLNNL